MSRNRNSAATAKKKSYRLLRNELDRFARDASRAALAGKEACGLLLEINELLHLIFLPNAAREGSFGFDRKMEARVRDGADSIGGAIVGTFHSHPYWLARPSRADLASSGVGDLLLIYDVTGRNFGLWRVKRKVRLKRPGFANFQFASTEAERVRVLTTR